MNYYEIRTRTKGNDKVQSWTQEATSIEHAIDKFLERMRSINAPSLGKIRPKRIEDIIEVKLLFEEEMSTEPIERELKNLFIIISRLGDVGAQLINNSDHIDSSGRNHLSEQIEAVQNSIKEKLEQIQEYQLTFERVLSRLNKEAEKSNVLGFAEEAPQEDQEESMQL